MSLVSEDDDSAEIAMRNALALRYNTAVRALRRPASWPREREQVARWAGSLLADETLTAVDVETTGLENAYAVQIAAVDRHGGVIFNEYAQPNAVLEPEAIAVHGVMPERVASAPTFAELLPVLTELFDGRTVVAYWAAPPKGRWGTGAVRPLARPGRQGVWGISRAEL
ncbi:exonuclease domain-containing protein [Streptomyces sp. 5-10]|uniref:3'-5' exonuclease n=1 Tax=Streptomyces sp. 5-10 TaxID=878925 RepID=UPI00168B09ED|nr:3'-5' exonuclease [Streptomyces sp. 5-10]MBD3008266.1 3'-5' exonuclease [Streptomyces sp. 5-10]